MAQGSSRNQILRLAEGRELLILAGRSWGHCGGLASAIVYDLTSGQAARAVFEKDMGERVTDESSEGLDFDTGALTPKDEIIDILWESLTRVGDSDVAYDCHDDWQELEGSGE